MSMHIMDTRHITHGLINISAVFFTKLMQINGSPPAPNLFDLATPNLKDTPTNAEAEHGALFEGEAAVHDKVRRRKRKRRRSLLDVEKEIESGVFKRGLRNKAVGLAAADFTKQVRGSSSVGGRSI